MDITSFRAVYLEDGFNIHGVAHNAGAIPIGAGDAGGGGQGQAILVVVVVIVAITTAYIFQLTTALSSCFRLVSIRIAAAACARQFHFVEFCFGGGSLTKHVQIMYANLIDRAILAHTPCGGGNPLQMR